MTGYRKWLLIVLALVLALALGVTGCASDDAADVDDAAVVTGDADLTVLKVGASPAPHAEILDTVSEQLLAEGIKLEIIEFSDYVQPNEALQSGELDANFFQHVPYLTNFNEENNTDLVDVLAVHFEPLTIYAGTSDDLSKIADGAKIAIPNDATNEARALLLLEAEGLIKLSDDAGITATPQDVVDNPHNIEFIEAEAAMLPRMLEDADFAVINGNFALSSGIDADLALASESADSTAANEYANVLVVKEGRENDAAILALIDALKSEGVRNFIEKTYAGVVVPVF